ncbi:MAG TPA: hypothetical protein VH437_03715 [Terriglobales bacterium]
MRARCRLQDHGHSLGEVLYTAKRVALSCFLLLLTLSTPLPLAAEENTPSKFDGPAELPRVHVSRALADTPAPGKTVFVKATDKLQDALNAANCGDTLKLEAGATFSGLFTLPLKPCDDRHWIIIRTSASDSDIPPEGTRINPCYAGISSLPSRPAYTCKAKVSVMPRLLFEGRGGSGPLILADGANHYRLIGIEVTRFTPGSTIYNLVSQRTQNMRSAVDHIVFDRMWIHGTAQDETTRGILLGTATHIAIVDSYFSDFHCIAKAGACTDSQAIAGGIGDGPAGPYKIENNFLESAGEGILFGGSSATATPADITIRRNHFYKPLAWKPGQPDFIGSAGGHPFIVKNLFELKNAQRVLFEANVLENCWGGFSQVGFGILLTPKNQYSGPRGSVCPICMVTDVTIRYNFMSHVAAGLQIANASQHGAGAKDGQRYSIHDLMIDDIDGAKYAGPGLLAQISTDETAPLLQHVTLDHITAFPPKMLLNIGSPAGRRMVNFSFTNSIVSAGKYPVWSTGGPQNCAKADVPTTTFDACFTPYRVTHNAIIDTGGNWPSGNFFPKDTKAVGFVDYVNGNYHLRPNSPFKSKGSDGKDLGADVDGIMTAIAGVR